MNTLNGYKYAFPIFSGYIEEDRFNLKNLIGTAFSIGKQTYITAGHVIGNNKAAHLRIGVIDEENNWYSAAITKFEINQDFDVAVFHAEYEMNEGLVWHQEELKNLMDVATFGYPFGLDIPSKSINIRSFKGYIVGRRPFQELKPKPYIYELSFACPRGLSGGALLEQKNGHVIGLILGNASSEIEIYSEEEIIDERTKHTFIKTETTKYGIALLASEFLHLNFDMLNGTVDDFLKSHNLM